MLTGLSLRLLKTSLKKRLQGDAAGFLQTIPVSNSLIFNRVDFIKEQCSNKKILHIGFTDYPFTTERIADKSLLHLQLKEVAKEIYGLDADEKAITMYADATGDRNNSYCDITSVYPESALLFEPDIILLGEVLEHLQNPHEAINILYNQFANGTKLLVTVPNYMALDNIAASLHKTESVHPHHYWYFSSYTLLRLFAAEKFTLEQLHFGMYYKPGTKINAILRSYPYCGDCIMAIFTINKKA